MRLSYMQVFTHRSNETAIDLAEKLIEIAPAGMGKVFFTNSGSEANDTQVKIVWNYNNALGRPEKKKIIARRRAYHGITLASGSMSGVDYAQKGFDVPIDRFLHVGMPHYWRGAEAGESEEDFATRMDEELDVTIRREGPETVAAFIAEPVMGAGGVLLPQKTYLHKVQEVMKPPALLLIVADGQRAV